MLACNCSENSKKHGKDKNGNQRFRCKLCGKTWVDTGSRPLAHLRLDMKQAEMVLKCLLEGMSIRATTRITGVSKNAILRLIEVAGERCAAFMEETIKDQPVRDIECDEIWGFIGCKERHARLNNCGPEVGDCYTFFAIERHTKCILAFHCGKRDTVNTERFTEKLAHAVSRDGSHQVNTDGFPAYGTTIWRYMSPQSSHGMIVKMFQSTGKGGRYSPGEIVSTKKLAVYGNVNKDTIGTSIVERSNLSMRMHVRRMTRLTNAHSKKWANHESMLAIWFAFYNFCRKHESLEGHTPAMAQGMTDKPLKISELLEAATL